MKKPSLFFPCIFLLGLQMILPPAMRATEEVYSSIPSTATILSTPSYVDGLNCLFPGQLLYVGSSIDSMDGSKYLILQGDGNLVIYYSGHPLWATATNGAKAAFLAMQGDGNVVLYGADWSVRWQSNTGGHNGAYLKLQNNGSIAIYPKSVKPTEPDDAAGIIKRFPSKK